MKPNKYVVEYCYGNHNEWSDEIEDYDVALNHAAVSSEIAGVSETRVWCDDEVMAVFVDGDFADEDDYEIDNEYDEPIDPFDEYGYDPYGGCFDMDL